MARKQTERYENGTIDGIIYNPITVKHMASQIILAVDEYISKKITEKALKERNRQIAGVLSAI